MLPSEGLVSDMIVMNATAVLSEDGEMLKLAEKVSLSCVSNRVAEILIKLLLSRVRVWLKIYLLLPICFALIMSSQEIHYIVVFESLWRVANRCV